MQRGKNGERGRDAHGHGTKALSSTVLFNYIYFLEKTLSKTKSICHDFPKRVY